MTKQFRDVFSFSLGGISTVLPFAAMPTIADNAMNRAISERIEKSAASRGDSPRSQVAADACPAGGSL